MNNLLDIRTPAQGQANALKPDYGLDGVGSPRDDAREGVPGNGEPIDDRGAIEARLSAVGELLDDPNWAERLRGALAASPTTGVLVLVMVSRRAGNFALFRPAREVLFTVVSPEAKYKAKAFIDAYHKAYGVTRIPSPVSAAQGYDAVLIFAAAVKQLGEWFAERKLRPHISARYPLAEAPRALRDMAERRVMGKVVLLTDA